MSNTAIMRVMQYSQSRGVQRLVLIALALHCNEARGDMVAWPNISTLANLAGCPRETASRAIKALIKMGEIDVSGEKIGRNPVYKISIRNVTTDHIERDVGSHSDQKMNVTTDHSDVMTDHVERDATSHKQEITRKEQEILPPISPTKSKSSKAKKETLVLPDPISPELWSEYVEMRVKIRKPMTDAAKKLAIAKLVKFGAQANASLEQSIFNSWQGLFEPKGQNNGKSNSFSSRTTGRNDTRENRGNVSLADTVLREYQISQGDTGFRDGKNLRENRGCIDGRIEFGDGTKTIEAHFFTSH